MLQWLPWMVFANLFLTMGLYGALNRQISHALFELKLEIAHGSDKQRESVLLEIQKDMLARQKAKEERWERWSSRCGEVFWMTVAGALILGFFVGLAHWDRLVAFVGALWQKP
jgi:hypothetical protein